MKDIVKGRVGNFSKQSQPPKRRLEPKFPGTLESLALLAHTSCWALFISFEQPPSPTSLLCKTWPTEHWTAHQRRLAQPWCPLSLASCTRSRSLGPHANPTPPALKEARLEIVILWMSWVSGSTLTLPWSSHVHSLPPPCCSLFLQHSSSPCSTWPMPTNLLARTPLHPFNKCLHGDPTLPGPPLRDPGWQELCLQPDTWLPRSLSLNITELTRRRERLEDYMGDLYVLGGEHAHRLHSSARVWPNQPHETGRGGGGGLGVWSERQLCSQGDEGTALWKATVCNSGHPLPILHFSRTEAHQPLMGPA